MNLRSIIVATAILLASMYIAIDVTSLALRGRHIIDVDFFSSTTNAPEITFESACTNLPKIKELSTASHAGLQRLQSYQEVCNSGVTDTLMIFTDMPKDSNEAKGKAKTMATTLKEFAKYNIRPLVIIEPVTTWGFIDFAEFRDGFYSDWLKDYFAALKANGVTDSQMGIWVPFPEANLPLWNHQSVKPQDFGLVVNLYVNIMKQYFPNSHASILLNSASYDNADFEWSNEEYVSLLPYVRKIDPKLIDSFGMQGFPWAPRSDSAHPNQFDASAFLSAEIITEAANFLNIDNVWFNTASFMQKYTLDSRSTITIAPETRQAIMSSIKDEAKKLKTLGFNVSVNIFAEDKSDSSEETNWSYWAPGEHRTNPHSVVFHNFVTSLHAEDIDLWLFDQ